MKTILNSSLSIAALTLLFPLSAQAGDETATPKTNHFGLGLNIGNSEMVYDEKDGDYLASLYPQYRGTKFNLDRESMSYRFLNKDNLQVEVLAKLEERDHEEETSSVLAGMEDRDNSINAGVRIGYKTNFGLLSLDATRDISGVHQGAEAELRFGPEFYNDSPSANRSFSFGPVIGAKWQSNKTVDHYYGVKSSEATASRAAYEGKSAVTPFVGLQANATLTKNISFTASALYINQPDEIADSPITDDDHDVEFNAGFTYWFR